MYIGQVSQLTGLTVKSIRFYEQKKLISTPQRKGRYRVYNQQIIDQLRLIIKAKSLGLTLNQFYDIQKMSSNQLNDNVMNKADLEIDWSVVFSYLEKLQIEKRNRIQAIENEIKEIELMKQEITKCI